MTTRTVRRPGAVRAVLDTNVALSALVFGCGRPARLRAAWQDGRVLPLVDRVTTAELVRVLAYPKFRLSADEQTQLLADYLPHAKVVPMPVEPPSVPTCRDAADLPFLRLARTGRASFLVSGDEDLLVLGQVGRCRIVRLDAFLDALMPSR